VMSEPSCKPSAGEVRIGGRTVKRHSPSSAARRGVALLPEDRRRQGSVPGMSVRENATLASIGKYRRGPFLRQRLERRSVAEMITRFRIKTSGMEHPMKELSGGNQQKVIVARWTDREPRILLFDEPTQGIDVGAKVEVMEIMRDLADAGCGVVFISSELDEVIQVADRVVVLREGAVRADLTHDEATIDAVLKACYGAEDRPAVAGVGGGAA
jgi:monosaccharide-transporting ATPase